MKGNEMKINSFQNDYFKDIRFFELQSIILITTTSARDTCNYVWPVKRHHNKLNCL